MKHMFGSTALVGMLALLAQSATAQECPGDCGADGAVAINELITCVNIVLETTPLEQCLACDANVDGAVTINELIAAVNIALGLLGPSACVDPGNRVLDPVPDGLLLSGSPQDRAIDALVNLAPTAVPAAAMQGTLLTTRLRAILAPTATVGDVNAALANAEAAIVSMIRGVPIVVLVIDPVENLAAAERRARELAQHPAFLAVFPARSFGAPSDAAPAPPPALPDPGSSVGTVAHVPDGAQGEGLDDYLLRLRMPAAWNARMLGGNDITVIIAEHFLGRNAHPAIDRLTFSFYGGFGNDAYGRNGNILGNEGPYSAGIIGGNWNTALPGIHPGPGLRIVGIPVGGLDIWEVSSAIYDELTLGGERFVLLTGLTFDEAEADALTALEKASMALNWRSVVRGNARDFEPRMIHVVPGGDQGFLEDAPPLGTDTSYWAVSARYDDLRGYLLSLDPSAEEVMAFDELVQSTGALSRLPLDNVVVVGASQADGSPLPTGAQLTDVRVLGESVFGPCELAEERTAPGIACDGSLAAYTGTFAAAPQVAGLGAYLWSLAPARSALELLPRIRGSFHDGFVDGYRAVLGLDPNLLDPRVRETLLDPNDDGRFDETDLGLFLDAFQTHTNEREQGNDEPDDSRFDLNGDGFTGGTTTTAFDLDADLQFGTVSTEGLGSLFDETAITDLEILCYYARSDLYFGDEGNLDSVLPGCRADTGPRLTLNGRSLGSWFAHVYWDADSEKDDFDGRSLRPVDSFDRYTTQSNFSHQTGESISAGRGRARSSVSGNGERGELTIASTCDAESNTSVAAAGPVDRRAEGRAEGAFRVHIEITGGRSTYSLSGRLEASGIGASPAEAEARAVFRIAPLGGSAAPLLERSAEYGEGSAGGTTELSASGTLGPGRFEIAIETTATSRTNLPTIESRAAAQAVDVVFELTPLGP